MPKQFEAVQLYINKYQNLNSTNAQPAVDNFLGNFSNWKNIVGYILEEKDGEKLYGEALVAFSAAIYEVNPITDTLIGILAKEILEYESVVKFMFKTKSFLYNNLGLCWTKLGSLYNNLAVEAFKKYIFYQLTLSNHTTYNDLTCYSFRSCSKFLFQSLTNNNLNLSSPTTFNDLFDCPIVALMDNYNDNLKLIRDAYISGIKIACFVKNEKSPYRDDELQITIKNKKKNRRDKREYLNELMWAHYADSHKGICIKYKFPSDLTTTGTKKANYVSYFRDVEYSSDLKKFSNQDAINMHDAFFVKGKSWKYENELRFLYYDPTNNNDYVSLPISNCIEAVYFGVKCSDKDKETIINILKNRKFISYKCQSIINSNKEINEEKEIEFYQMRIHDKIFGAIKI